MDLLSTRPARLVDAAAIHRLIAATELDLDGKVEVDPDDVVSDLSRPGRDLATDTVLVHEPDGALVGWAQVLRGTHAEADVRPDRRGRGLGTWLLDWTEQRARAAGAAEVSQMVTDNNRAAADLFAAHGYRPKDTAWILQLPLGPGLAAPQPPDPITIREYRPGVDDRGAHRVVEEAFGEWPEARPRPYEEWAATSIQRETFAPALSTVALDGDRVVGVALALDGDDPDDGWIQQLAVHRDYRHRGIARALLLHSFGGFARAGRRWGTLSTSS
jgi:ribosomal protein S18 acetylase RimI-like enzyme